MYFEINNLSIGYIAVFYTVLSLLIYWKLSQPIEAQKGEKSSAVQIKRCVTLLLGLFVFALFVSVSGGFLAHQDTAWHQVALRADNDRIPGRLIIYSVFYPAYLIMGGTIAWYAKARFSRRDFDGAFKIALACTTMAPFMFLPSQDPELMILSSDWFNIVFRSVYWLMMFVWISSLFYMIARLVLIVVSQTKIVGMEE
jgi:hypothetical protein